MITFYREQDRFEALLYQKFYRMLKVKKSENFQKSFIKFQICVREKTNKYALYVASYTFKR